MANPEHDEVWRRWREGETQRAIARALHRAQPSIFKVIHARGGVAPAARHRAARVLQRWEREEISRGLAAGWSLTAIARSVGRHRATISREVRRHSGRQAYRADLADRRAWRNAGRPKACRLAQAPRLCRIVTAKLEQHWSPEQIAGWLKRTYPDDPRMQISHETLYRSLFIQARGALKTTLVAHLRRGRTMRRSRRATTLGQGRGMLVEAVSIRERPAEVDDRAVPGHWEADLLIGNPHSQIGTLVERTSRFVLLMKLPNRETDTVVRALTQQALRLPDGLMRSLTVDRGREFAAHRRFTVATDVAVYFCDPHSPWQRGSNENTNGLLRQYFPKGHDLSGVSQAELNRVARQLNQRPRKTLGFQSPADKLASIVASTS